MIYINAVGVSSHGGRCLLHRLLCDSSERKDIYFYLDSRIDKRDIEPYHVNYEQITNTFFSRFLLECKIKWKIKKQDILVNFNNLPPILNFKNKVFIYLQNVHVVMNIKELLDCGYLSLSLLVKQIIFISCMRSHYVTIVQTNSMKKKVSRQTAKVCIRPILPNMTYGKMRVEKKGFFYPSNAMPHKNHQNLILAWLYLLEEFMLSPELILTISRDDLDHNVLSIIDSNNLNIRFSGAMSHNNVLEKYGEVEALIFPSLSESFGLPLLEATCQRVPILASKLDYVDDIIGGYVGFDPNNYRDIAKQIKQFISGCYKIRSPYSKVDSDDVFSLDSL